MTNSNTESPKVIIDSKGTAHFLSTCEELTLPAVGDCPLDAIARLRFPLCADCEPDIHP